MQKKAFTLVELLAVIVILSIILLIAVPAVKKSIDSARMSTAKDTAIILSKTAENYYMENYNDDLEKIDLTDGTLSYSGKKPDAGYALFNEDGEAYVRIYYNGYCAIRDYNGNVTINKTKEEDCIKELKKYVVTLNDLTYADGTEIYFNPVTNKTCTKEESDKNTSKNSGCMKWYIFNDTSSATTLNLLLSHNTTASTNPSVSGYREDLVLKQLQSDISGWNSNVKSTTRLLKDSEVISLIDYTGDIIYDYCNNSSGVSGCDIIFDSASQNYMGIYTNFRNTKNITSSYNWLFNNTDSCIKMGCTTEESGTYGYWVQNTSTSNGGYAVSHQGALVVNVIESYGIRPVITIPKAKTIEAIEEGKYDNLPDASRVGYTFDGWYTNDNVKITKDSDVTDITSLTAKYTKLVKLTVTKYTALQFVLSPSTTKNYYSSGANVSVSYLNGSLMYCKVTTTGGITALDTLPNYEDGSNNKTLNFTITSDATLNISCTCLVAGTYIEVVEEYTDKKGRKRKRRVKKRIEDLTYDDDIVVWDFDNGCFTTAKALWLMKKHTTTSYNVLTFSDGTVLKTVGQHRIFNKELGKFTYPMTDETPIGTTTFNANGEEVTLVSKERKTEYVEYYNLITKYHMNAFANGILTSCRFSNLYKIENMKYVKDNRELVSKDEYADIPLEYYEGLRLAEQPRELNRDNDDKHASSISEHIKRIYIDTSK